VRDLPVWQSFAPTGTHGRSWLDSFEPFVAEALRQSSAAEVGEAEVQQALRTQFGIDIPEGVLRTILRRATRRGLVVQKNHRHILRREALNRHDLSGQRKDALRQQAALVDKLCQFVKNRGRILSRDDGEQMLLDHVEQLALPLVRTALIAGPYPGLRRSLVMSVSSAGDPEGGEGPGGVAGVMT
jgi:hypothetical protein